MVFIRSQMIHLNSPHSQSLLQLNKLAKFPSILMWFFNNECTSHHWRADICWFLRTVLRRSEILQNTLMKSKSTDSEASWASSRDWIDPKKHIMHLPLFHFHSYIFLKGIKWVTLRAVILQLACWKMEFQKPSIATVNRGKGQSFAREQAKLIQINLPIIK